MQNGEGMKRLCGISRNLAHHNIIVTHRRIPIGALGLDGVKRAYFWRSHLQ